MHTQWEIALAVVINAREQLKRSPGLSSAPFSDSGWSVIEAALRAMQPPPVQVSAEPIWLANSRALSTSKTVALNESLAYIDGLYARIRVLEAQHAAIKSAVG